MNCTRCHHSVSEHITGPQGFYGACKHRGYNPSTHDDIMCQCPSFKADVEPPKPTPFDELKTRVKAFFDAEAEWEALNMVKDPKQLVRETAIKLDKARTALLKAAGLES